MPASSLAHYILKSLRLSLLLLVGWMLIPAFGHGVDGGFSSWFATHSPLDWEGWFTICLFVVVLIALIREVLPPDIVMLIGAGVLVITGVITPEQLGQGFARDIIFILGTLFIVAEAVEVNGILAMLSRYILPRNTSRWRQLLSMMFPVSGFSAFMNNTPIVLMLTPAVRRWALDHGISPSKFFIPLSYAAIMGGVCTLIGTSTNLVVDGLLRAEEVHAGLSFFELGWVGIPIILVGFSYMLSIGYRLLPDRADPAVSLTKQTQEFTSEFTVQPDCPLDGMQVKDASRRHFHGEMLIEIERGPALIDSPSPDEVIQEGDRLIFAGDIKQIAKLHSIKGLQSVADPHFHLEVDSPHFSEVVISITSSLVGKSLKRIDFRNSYGASVIAIYRQGERIPGPIGEVILHAGDTLMLLSPEEWAGGDYQTNDFYYIRHNEELSLHAPWRVAMVGGVITAMVASVIMGVPMVIATMTAAILMVGSRAISIRDASRSIHWNVLLLIGSSFAFGNALRTSGVATYLAESLIPVLGHDPRLLIGGVMLLTMMLTEVITNNAAALLLFPIAIQTARLSGYESIDSMKAVGVAVAVGASCSFITPIGYQTNTIVYGPGGYHFTDYTKVGLPLSLMILVLCTFLIPIIWPLTY